MVLLDQQEFQHSEKMYVDLTIAIAMAAPTQAESAGFSRGFSAFVVGKCGSKQLFDCLRRLNIHGTIGEVTQEVCDGYHVGYVQNLNCVIFSLFHSYKYLFQLFKFEK